MRFAKFLVVAAVATAGLVPAAAAQADRGPCPANRSCLYGNNDFVFLIAGPRAPNYGILNLAGEANDQMDSWINNSGTASRGYAHSGGSGDCQSFHAEDDDTNVASWNSDEVSSWRTDGGC